MRRRSRGPRAGPALPAEIFGIFGILKLFHFGLVWESQIPGCDPFVNILVSLLGSLAEFSWATVHGAFGIYHHAALF